MDFGLSPTQKLIRETMLHFGQKKCQLSDLRDDKKWADVKTAFDELAMAQMLIPEDKGGLSALFLDAVCVQEILGYFAAPISFITNGVLVPMALHIKADDKQRQIYFDHLNKNNIDFGCALARFDKANPSPIISDKQDKLTGELALALECSPLSTHILTNDHKGDLFILPKSEALITLVSTIDTSRQLSHIKFHHSHAERLLGARRNPFKGSDCDYMLAIAQIMIAADMLGAAQSMLERAVTYSKQREQFGRVIGSFQAVKHLCADMAARLEPCRAMLWYAAHCFDDDISNALSMAALTKAHISEVSRFIARSAIEVYGGMGFAEESGMHFWFKRIGLDYQLFGSPEILRELAFLFLEKRGEGEEKDASQALSHQNMSRQNMPHQKEAKSSYKDSIL